MTDDATLKAFYRIFQGNRSFFVTHRAPFSEKEGKLKAAWCGFAAYGTKSFPKVPDGKEKGDLTPLTKEHYKEHLADDNGLAIAPLCNTSDKKLCKLHEFGPVRDRNNRFTGAYCWRELTLYVACSRAKLGLYLVPSKGKYGLDGIIDLVKEHAA